MSRITVPQIFDDENVYVEGMTVHAQLDETFEGLMEFHGLVAAGATGLLGTTAVVAGESVDVDVHVDDFFGRTVRVVTTGTGVVTLVGKDYLNQVVTAEVDLDNDTVQTLKAFKRIDRIDSTNLTADLTIGPGAAIGLPFATRDVLAEYSGTAEQTTGTFVVPDQTDPATSETGDPRGTVIPGTTLNGSNTFTLKAVFMPECAGGLYGVRAA